MRKRFLISILMPAMVLTACERNKNVSEPYLPFVKQALTDTSSASKHILDKYVPNNVAGSIAVIGDFEPVCRMVSDFLCSDRFDNIDGREQPDELHDFAGETFTPVFDMANSPYAGYIEAENIPAMREAAVSMAVASLGSSCYSNTFDEDMTSSRIPAKVLIVDSPYLCRYALKDIDTLLVSAGIDVPVLSLSDEMMRRAGTRHPNGLIAVLAGSKEIEYGLYKGVYERCSNGSDSFPDYIEHTVSGADSKTVFMEFLDNYLASGAQEKISAVLVGVSSDSLNVRELSEVLEEIRTSQGLDMENYRAVLDENFEFIGGEDAVIQACYNVLRGHNLFTHKIAYPSVKAYVTVPSSSVPLESVSFGGTLSDKFKYNHSADASIQITRTVPLGRLYMSDEYLEKVNRLVAPVILNMDRLTE